MGVTASPTGNPTVNPTANPTANPTMHPTANLFFTHCGFLSPSQALFPIQLNYNSPLCVFHPTQVHDYNYLNELLCQNNPDRPKLSDETKAVTPPVLRPLVAVHPESGKEALYVPGGARYIKDGKRRDDHPACRHRPLLRPVLPPAVLPPRFARARVHGWLAGWLGGLTGAWRLHGAGVLGCHISSVVDLATGATVPRDEYS